MSSGSATTKGIRSKAAVASGVSGAVILSGVEESALLLELFTDRGVGTLIQPDDDA